MVATVLRDLPVPLPQIARINVDQYHRMWQAGVLRDGEPIELLEGFLVYKDRSAAGEDPMTVGKKHNLVVQLLNELNSQVRPYGCHLQIQGPLAVPPDQEPEPDGAIVRGDPRAYAVRLPGPADTHCVIEVADSSLALDRTTKLRLYAQAGIPQYVLINLVEMQVEVFEQPLIKEGRYLQAHVSQAGQTIPVYVGRDQRLQVQAEQVLP